MLKTVWHVFYLECLLRVRRSHEWLYPLIFFVMTLCLFPFVFTSDSIALQNFFPGYIWIAALFASLLSIETVFLSDVDEGSLEQFMFSETPLTLLIFAKLFAQWLSSELPLIILTPLLASLFHLPFMVIFYLCCSLLLGTPIFTLLGGFCMALTLGLRQQGVLLGLLLLPLITPVLIFGVGIVQQSQAGFFVSGPLAFLAGCSLFAISSLPWAIAATLRLSLED